MPTSTSRLGFSQDHYVSQLDGYRQYENVPLGILEHQLQESALGDCSGMTVLDLGGGQGLRARQAIDHGAVAVDVVDSTKTFSILKARLLYRNLSYLTLLALVSPEMMQAGQKIEEALGRGSKLLQWFEADVSRPEDLARCSLRFEDEGYDIVMANWLFDHAASMDVLDGMMRSCVAYLKPGGRFLGTRTYGSTMTMAGRDGKYGLSFKDHAEVPGGGGVTFRYTIHVDPPAEFEAGSMDVTYRPEKMVAFHERYGLEDTQIEPFENASWIRSDPEYWKLLLEEPNFAVVKARKKIV